MRHAGPMLVAALAVGASASAHAADMIRAGKWEFAAQVQVPNLPQLPPGVTLPPGINIGPGGINVTRTSCVSQGTAVPPDLHPPAEQHGQCKLEKLDRNGGSVRWLTTCTSPQGTVRSEGVAHYSGDRMEATLTTRTMAPGGHTQDSSQRITGRYLGPCDAH
jgi:uncharacterized protein DUF3617